MENLVTNQYDTSAIMCPECGGGYLHRGRVEVFSRHREDADEGTHVVVDGKETTVDSSLDGNVSSRRSSVKITFECEFCRGETRTLRISQHKGNEFVSWDY